MPSKKTSLACPRNVWLWEIREEKDPMVWYFITITSDDVMNRNGDIFTTYVRERNDFTLYYRYTSITKE